MVDGKQTDSPLGRCGLRFPTRDCELRAGRLVQVGTERGEHFFLAQEHGPRYPHNFDLLSTNLGHRHEVIDVDGDSSTIVHGSPYLAVR